ncbi:MAG TPA: acetyl-CoA C-acetyltransferase [Terriglobia bacterium]|nr:acetyl-CoA C-acetyltransferase [Terriglobia bacterium]
MNDPVILSAVRTPIGRFLGALKSLSAPELGAIAVKAAVERAGLSPVDIDETIMGNVLAAGLGQNPARQAAMGAGLPAESAAMTINKVCGSGLKAVALAAQAIQTDNASIVVAGGMESMSRAPYLLERAREGYRLGNAELVDSMIRDGLWDVYGDVHMGITAEVVSEKYGVPRERQDMYALESHRRAVAAMRAGRFKDEIVGVPVQQKKGAALLVDTDEAPRPEATLESLAALKPAFRKDGTVTAGNAPGVNDGAAALVVTSAERAAQMKRAPLVRIVGQAVSGIEPMLVMMAPVEAVRRLVKKVGWNLQDVDLIELNEAFAVQAVAVVEQLGLDPARVNVNGGAVALGHPIGASGARILVTLIHEMQRRGARRGIAALCLGGGNSVAVAVER